MYNKDVLKQVGIDENEIEKEVNSLFNEEITAELDRMYTETVKQFEVDTIVKGKIVGSSGDDVIVDIGYKSEGLIPLEEFPDRSQLEVGADIDVLLESVESESGTVVVSKAKADKIKGWEKILNYNKEGDVLQGKVIRKIKGGLLVDVGVPVFLPSSQVDVRRLDDYDDLIGKEIRCKIIKIDQKRMNVIVSRRKLIEEEREEQKIKLFNELKEGDEVYGVVKNIAEFGAFVDLGGIDGLLHITDMSWGRISHPAEIIKKDERIKVKILKIDHSQGRISLGLKQLVENPWEKVMTKYPPNSRIKGKVVNILPYGVFVELEPGIEGLVHISEMSWTKKISSPEEIVSIGDEIEVLVLNVDLEKQEISLGMKQLEPNPWQEITTKYTVGQKVKAKIRNILSYGVVAELESGIDGFINLSDISWSRKIGHPEEILKRNDEVEAVVLSIDPEKKKINLGIKQLKPNPWETTIPEKYKTGTVWKGVVTKLTNFGVFVDLESDVGGLIHYSRDTNTDQAKELKLGDVVEVEVVYIHPSEMKIGLKLINIIKKKK